MLKTDAQKGSFKETLKKECKKETLERNQVITKGQLISKQNCRAVTSSKNKLSISALEDYYLLLVQKRVYLLAKSRQHNLLSRFSDL